MNNYIKRVFENLKLNYLRMLGVLIVGYGVGYYLNWEILETTKIVIPIIIFVMVQNSFLLNSNKNLFFSIIYGMVFLWLFYFIYYGKISTEGYTTYIIYFLDIYFLYGVVQSFVLYQKQKKIEMGIYLKFMDELKKYGRNFDAEVIASNIGVSEEYLSRVVVSYGEDDLI